MRIKFAQSFETGSPQKYVPFHLMALKAELEYVQAEIRKKGIDADLGTIAKTLYRLDKDEEILNQTGIYPDKLQKVLDELNALDIRYSKAPIPEEIKNAL